MSDYGLRQSSVCINAQTSEFHTENDCTYIVINVPKQDHLMKADSKVDYHFIFKLREKENIGIKLIRGTSFIFTGKCLTHRQNCSKLISNNDGLFFNFASYGSHKLYSHIKKIQS